MTTSQNIIKKRLEETFSDAIIKVTDESYRHKGHLSPEILEKGSHFFVQVTSKDFKGKMPLSRHRMVYALMNDLMRDNIIHALRLELKTYEEADA